MSVGGYPTVLFCSPFTEAYPPRTMLPCAPTAMNTSCIQAWTALRQWAVSQLNVLGKRAGKATARTITNLDWDSNTLMNEIILNDVVAVGGGGSRRGEGVGAQSSTPTVTASAAANVGSEGAEVRSGKWRREVRRGQEG